MLRARVAADTGDVDMLILFAGARARCCCVKIVRGCSAGAMRGGRSDITASSDAKERRR